MDFDKALSEVGSFGLYQKVIISVLMPAVLPCAFHAYSQLFIASTPNHWCRVPELERWSALIPNVVKNLSIPLEYKEGHLRYSQCQMYARNYSEIVAFLHALDPSSINETAQAYEQTDFSVSNFEISSCKHGWVYDKQMFPNTVAMEVR